MDERATGTGAPPAGGLVCVALSGGVDSAVAAGLLLRAGYQVFGVTLHLQAQPEDQPNPESGCCSPAAVEDARRVCQVLGIPFYVLNYEREFGERVIREFCAEYARGRTPNPCLACNREIKFDLLLRQACALGADYLATGHYARIRRDERGRFHLLKGADSDKDQSYVLYMLGQAQLVHLLFPLGGYRKQAVRALAAEWGLPVAAKAESQDICFVGAGDYRAFLKRQAAGSGPGPIFDVAGHRLGTHTGLARYTVGQRRGLGLGGPRQWYVVALDVARNAVVVGERQHLLACGATLEQPAFVLGEPPGPEQVLRARVRYRAPEVPVRLRCEGGAFAVDFAEPQPAVTPGQALVLYEGDEVAGGGIIAGARPCVVVHSATHSDDEPDPEGD